MINQQQSRFIRPQSIIQANDRTRININAMQGHRPHQTLQTHPGHPNHPGLTTHQQVESIRIVGQTGKLIFIFDLSVLIY